MNADRREEKPTGGGRQRMKQAWKEQTGGLREEGKSKMAQIFRNEVSKYVYITSYRPNGSKRRMVQIEASVYWSFFLFLKNLEFNQVVKMVVIMIMVQEKY